MDAYRDQYAQLFGTGNDVKVLAISADADTAQASWARDKGYPVTFLSDLGSVVGRQYGAFREFPGGKVVDNRTLFIIGKDGKIAHVMAPFREVDPAAYTELGDMVKKAAAMK
jgi:peroxiredoxin